MRKSLLVLLIALSYACSADLWWNTKKGKSLYKKGKYDKAQQQFDLASAAAPASQEGQFNRALNLARIGKIGEAKQLLGSIKFDNPAKAAELAFTTARVNEMEGDLAVQKQDLGTAKKAYSEALRQNVAALKANPTHKGALKNAEITGRKLASLPDDKNQNKQNQNQQNQQNQDQQQNQQNQDQKKEDQNKDQNDKKDDQKKEDQNKDQNKNDPKNDQNKDKKDQPKPNEPKEDPNQQNAAALLDKYGDDGKDLNRPPVGKVKKSPGGKDW